VNCSTPKPGGESARSGTLSELEPGGWKLQLAGSLTGKPTENLIYRVKLPPFPRKTLNEHAHY
jgi:hypothetical protein